MKMYSIDQVMGIRDDLEGKRTPIDPMVTKKNKVHDLAIGDVSQLFISLLTAYPTKLSPFK